MKFRIPMFLKRPKADYVLIAVLCFVLLGDLLISDFGMVLLLGAFLGAFPTLYRAVRLLFRRRIGIHAFNAVALVISFATGEIKSAAFIALMLIFADLLDWHTESRSRRAVEELLKLKPLKALREKRGRLEEVSVGDLRKNDIVVVEGGARVPVDGVVIYGQAFVNESSVTGESLPVKKIVGDTVIASTLNETGVLKVRTEKIGRDSTLERMLTLVKEAGRNKSHSEKLADRFAAIFLPIVVVLGLLTYIFTRNLKMTTALFLVACADDMAVAIPLAIVASLGRAAKRGIIIKGGEWIEALAKIKILILDKTGTLTYGKMRISNVHIEPGVGENEFWRNIAVAEKYSEHPTGRAIMEEAVARVSEIPDPDEFRIYKGSGVVANIGKDEIAVGTKNIMAEAGIGSDAGTSNAIKEALGRKGTVSFVFINKKLAGFIEFADTPRPEAKESMRMLKQIGVKRIVMFTGDNPEIAGNIAASLGIKHVHAAMKPEDKLRELEALLEDKGTVGMVGDGINDAPALMRADVGIAMGGAGTAVAIEAADAVILTDNLFRLPEMILFSRKTISIVKGNMAIWAASNVVGFVLVFAGIFTPALAAFYNFVTDFLPLFNSTRLFKPDKKT